VEASPAGDCCLPIREDAAGRYVGLHCPDCGGDRIAWAEAVRLPGSRECLDCGSRLTDSRYGCMVAGADCVRRRAAVILLENPAAGDPIGGPGGRTIAAAQLARRAGWTAADREATIVETLEAIA